MSVAPNSVRKTRARRVFGEVVIDLEEEQNDIGNSLCYSSCNSDSSSFLQRNEPFPVSKDTTKLSSGKGQPESQIIADEKENEVNRNIFSRPLSNKSLKSEAESAAAVPTTIRMPFPEELVRQENRLPTPHDGSVKTNERSTKQASGDDASKNFRRRRDLANKTKKAITEATASVNESLTAARTARSINLQEKAQQTSRFRDDWNQEKEEARQFQEESARMRRGLLDLQSQLSSKFQQQRSRTKAKDRAARLKAISEQSEFESQVYRDHQKSLKDERDRKRRESTQARAKLRENYRQGEEKLQSIELQEHLALMEERNEGYNASASFKKENADDRRKSYVFRSGDAKRIREIYNRMKDEEAAREEASYNLKFEGERDAQAYKNRLEEERRKSFAFRNKEGSKQRKLLLELEEADNEQEHQSYELKRNGEKDAERYMKKW
mmetsp:Transcript_10689/g.16342  ORF Transcript_10689/g.16342 Transcript_10689/m.16342 type:complete len:439 (+) Transcript_10689:133-1449(+)